MNVNSICISGNLTKDAVMRQSNKGTTVTTTTIAFSTYRGGQYESNFLNLVIFGELGERLCERLVRGVHITVQGELQQSSWEKDGQKYSGFEVKVSRIDIDKGKQPQKEQPEAQASLYDSDIPF